MKRVLVAVCLTLGMLAGVGGVASATEPTHSVGFPPRVVWKWFEAARLSGPLQLPIGPPCYGLTVWELGGDLDGDSFCTTEPTWRKYEVGDPYYGYVGH